ncbi:MAG: sulfate adenylyltransferase subunit CysN [Lysobacterales bacterium]
MNSPLTSNAPDNIDLLRFITCGSVDDGKSTLLGRLLYESRQIYDDQLATLRSESQRMGTQNGELDFALLVDGLEAEREQGITIDVAYRYFATQRRRFIVADTPGHEQYTRNMVTGASNAELAILLVDARKGILTQTRRHAYLVHLLGIRQLILAVNKMDLVDWSEAVFDEIREDFQDFANQLGIDRFHAIPLSALHGDNLWQGSERSDWYHGATLMGLLESLPAHPQEAGTQPARFPVQWVSRPNQDFRGYAGTLASGVIRPGDRLRVQPSGRSAQVARIVTADGDLAEATAGQAVTLTLTEELDISRGDLLSSAEQPAESADQFEATIVWMHEQPLLPGRSYAFKLASSQARVQVTDLKYRVNVNTLEHTAASTLGLNDIGVASISLDRPVGFDPYREIRDTGAFLIIDRESGQTLGAGMIHFALRRASNIHRQALDVDKQLRAGLKAQRPCVLWFTGLSGAGKSTIANAVEKRLAALGHHTYLLDGDNVRHGLNRDLGFTDVDRVENIRRIAEVARLMVDAGLIVLTAFISPFRSEREMARGLLGEGEFFEIHVDTPLAEAERRDVKGLYAKARRGELKNFTGIDSPYEPPLQPEMRLDTVAMDVGSAADAVVERLRAEGYLDGTGHSLP